MAMLAVELSRVVAAQQERMEGLEREVNTLSKKSRETKAEPTK